MFDVEKNAIVQFTYTNWEGKTAVRTCRVIGFMYGKNEWHPEEQFLLKGLDKEREAIRTYAVKDISDVQIIERW